MNNILSEKRAVTSIIYRLVITILAIIGVVLVAGKWESLIFYTILSNILVGGFFGFLAIKGIIELSKTKDNTKVYAVKPFIQVGVVFVITVTFLVYATLLSWQMNFTMEGTGEFLYSRFIGNMLVHYVVPIMAIADWLVFSVKGQLSWKNALSWLLVPFVYYIVIVIRALVGGELSVTMPDEFGGHSRYPYPFIDADKLGWGKVIINVVVIAIVLFGVACLIVYIDKSMKKHQDKKITATMTQSING